MPVHAELLELLRCPKCHGKLTSIAGSTGVAGASLACSGCRLSYPVVDDIPQLLVDEARPLENQASPQANQTK